MNQQWIQSPLYGRQQADKMLTIDKKGFSSFEEINSLRFSFSGTGLCLISLIFILACSFGLITLYSPPWQSMHDEHQNLIMVMAIVDAIFSTIFLINVRRRDTLIIDKNKDIIHYHSRRLLKKRHEQCRLSDVDGIVVINSRVQIESGYTQTSNLFISFNNDKIPVIMLFPCNIHQPKKAGVSMEQTTEFAVALSDFIGCPYSYHDLLKNGAANNS